MKISHSFHEKESGGRNYRFGFSGRNRGKDSNRDSSSNQEKDNACDNMTDFELVDALGRISGVEIPQAIESIRNAEILHDTECETNQMQETVKRFLNM